MIEAGSIPLLSHWLPLALLIVGLFLVVLVVRLAARRMLDRHGSNVQQMEEASIEKLELVSQLAASVAHEIRNPITVVRGYAQLMQGYEYTYKESQNFLALMIEELDKAESVISDYLQLSQNTVDVQSVEVDFSGVIDRCVDYLQPYALSHNVSLYGRAEAGIVVMGNKVRLTKAVSNLLKNAIESHDHDGSVNVQLTQGPYGVALTVSDSGRGIPPEMLGRLGVPYYSTTSRGTGLGLTFVYKVIQEMDGTIEVISSEDIGTTFTVALPAVQT